MKIKKNDTVKMIAGKDKGKTGKVLRVFPDDGKIVVEGVNVLAKHVRPRQQGEQGQKVYFPSRVSVSNAQVVCPKCGQSARIGYVVRTTDTNRIKDRVCKKCTQPLA